MDRTDMAVAAIQEQGLVFRDKFNQLKANPAVAVETQNRAQILKLLLALKLGDDAAPDSTRAAIDLARKRWRA